MEEKQSRCWRGPDCEYCKEADENESKARSVLRQLHADEQFQELLSKIGPE